MAVVQRLVEDEQDGNDEDEALVFEEDLSDSAGPVAWRE
jgi:hypothetical protein